MSDLKPGQASIRGLVIGPGTPYDLMTGTKFFTRSVRATGTAPRTWSDGSWSGAEFLNEAEIPLRVIIRTNSEAEWLEAYRALAHAMRPVYFGGAVELRWIMGGEELCLRGSPRMIDPDLDLASLGRSKIECGFVATDPLVYSGAEESIIGIPLPTYAGGLTVPHTVPFVVSGYRIDDEREINYRGTADAGMRIVFHAPDIEEHPNGTLTSPSCVVLSAEGDLMKVTAELEIRAGQWLEIDTANRTALLNGTANRRSTLILEPRNDFPVLRAGMNTVRFRGDDTTNTSTMDLHWLSAWY